MIALVPLLCFAVFCLLWPVVAADKPARVLPLSSDDEALREHYRSVEMNKVKDLRKQSESIRRHYECITWPAIQAEYRRRDLDRHVPTMREMIA